MSAFAKLKDKLMKKGKSEESAGAIAYSIGKKKFGAKRMAIAAKEHKPAAKVK